MNKDRRNKLHIKKMLFNINGFSSGFRLHGNSDSSLLLVQHKESGKYAIGDTDTGDLVVDFKLSEPFDSDYLGGPFYRIWDHEGNWGVLSSDDKSVIIPIEGLKFSDVTSLFWNRRSENRGSLIALLILLLWKLQSLVLGRKIRIKKRKRKKEQRIQGERDFLTKMFEEHPKPAWLRKHLGEPPE